MIKVFFLEFQIGREEGLIICICLILRTCHQELELTKRRLRKSQETLKEKEEEEKKDETCVTGLADLKKGKGVLLYFKMS